MNKKAELVSKYTITVFVIIFSFAVMLVFYLNFDWTGQINTEVCHESIIMRSTFNIGTTIETGRNTIPLKCQTEKICISRTGGDCKYNNMIDVASNPVQKIKLDSDSVKARTQIMDIFAEKLYECHSMLGEGKLNFMPANFFEGKVYCFPCARIAFEDFANVYGGNGFSLSEWYNYLNTKYTPQGKSYFEYLYGNTYGQRISYMQSYLKETKSKETIDTAQAIFSSSIIFANSARISKADAVAHKILPAFLSGFFVSDKPTDFLLTQGNGYIYQSPDVYPYDAGQLKAAGCTFEFVP